MFKSDIYINDLKESINSVVNYQNLANKKILVTGSTGMIGSTIVDLLLQLNEEKKLNIEIYATSRSIDKLKQRFGIENNLFFIQYDATSKLESNISFDYIIHSAGYSSPDLYIKKPVEIMTSNILGINNLFEYSIKNNCKRLLYISSSEVYGKKDSVNPFKEEDYGFIDILSLRSCYPSSKRTSETLCVSYSNEYNVDSVIVRPGHIYGPTSLKDDKKVSSLFAINAINGEDIILKSSGTQLRSYCYIVDCASAILTVLINGNNCEAYNISNKDSIVSIRDMAQAFANAGNCKIKFENPDDIEKKSFNQMDNSSLDSKKLESLGWHALTTIEIGTKHTVEILKKQ